DARSGDGRVGWGGLWGVVGAVGGVGRGRRVGGVAGVGLVGCVGGGGRVGGCHRYNAARLRADTLLPRFFMPEHVGIRYTSCGERDVPALARGEPVEPRATMSARPSTRSGRAKPDILGRRALPSGRLAASMQRRDSYHGLLVIARVMRGFYARERSARQPPSTKTNRVSASGSSPAGSGCRGSPGTRSMRTPSCSISVGSRLTTRRR